jgi:hypothetical protein
VVTSLRWSTWESNSSDTADEQASKALNLENEGRTCREFCQQQSWPMIDVAIESSESGTQPGQTVIK